MKRIRAATWDNIEDVTDDIKPEEQHPALVEFRPRQTAEGLANGKYFRSAGKVEGDKGGNDKNENNKDSMVAHVHGIKFASERLPVDTFGASTRTYIAVFEKATNELHMIETADFYRMRPLEPVKGRGKDDSGDEEMENIKEEEVNMTDYEKKANMLRLFGGKASAKRYSDYQRKRKQIITMETARDEAQKAAELVAKNEADTKEEGDGTSKHLVPPHNTETIDPMLAYPLIDMCPPESYEEFKANAPDAIEALRGNDPQNPGWHDYTFLLLMEVAGDDIEPGTKLQRAISCFYLNMLVNIMHGPNNIEGSSYAKLASKWKISENVAEELLKKFMEHNRNGLSMTLRTKDKIVYHAAVLWLAIGGFNNVQGLGKLADALEISHKEMAQFVQRVGGKLSKDKGTNTGNYGKYRARLAVPLVFPTIKVVKRRRKSKYEYQ